MIAKETWTNKEVRQKNQDTYESYGWQVPYANPWQYDISNLQPEHANPGSSESDLVSGKMKEEVVIYIIVIQTRY